uniref:Uncharacterized protein n=1 Tax=Coccolithus braarudii TaxID=221442 RepID=A0A7S0L1R9_9EUKA|mmetsp:Transcript_14932/g.32406  ORF Transcript_14932/g.32406 Transcript_14932/m.32406 type:complete len:297 (+) Transcript_14932:60-950(+)|eukprot:CAMPEP_0183342854 /NCGR_PEP_ID=MMETSP0164_2-20130417/8882_1 /TAXON_ID=221442 /ORGANISM="Coccolithus pelagicus ssp braarudi, Strain PLY182g" /LENGTH=296 /DNA_ID=CAMNT_0025513555 /DNA_START=52 /DNA_END=942 /DNA_ORIENTATION=-
MKRCVPLLVMLRGAASFQPPPRLARPQFASRAAPYCVRSQFDDFEPSTATRAPSALASSFDDYVEQPPDAQSSGPFSAGGARSMSDGPRLPTEKQINYAQRLAIAAAENFPEDILVSSEACSAFIDRLLRQTPPSKKQVDYAQLLAFRAGEALPADALMSASACSAYIDRLVSVAQAGGGVAQQTQYGGQRPQYQPAPAAMSGGAQSAVAPNIELAAGGPSQKQVIFAVKLAQAAGVGLSAEALRDKGECSRFIEERLALQSSMPPASASPSVTPYSTPAAAQTQPPAFKDEDIPF